MRRLIPAAPGKGETKMEKQIFINLAVRNLEETKEFFTRLGFQFNPQFSDENAVCMIIGKNNLAMFLTEKFFKDLIPGKEIVDAQKNAEAIIAISAENHAELDEMIKKVTEAGGKEYRKAQDYGWMYGRAFEDINGHIWEIFYMDEKAMPEDMKKRGQMQ